MLMKTTRFHYLMRVKKKEIGALPMKFKNIINVLFLIVQKLMGLKFISNIFLK